MERNKREIWSDIGIGVKGGSTGGLTGGERESEREREREREVKETGGGRDK